MAKSPKAEFNPTSGKIPRVAEDPNAFLRLNPSWRIAKMEFTDPFGWHVVDGAKLEYIRQKLAAFERMSWEEILVKSKKQNHSVPIKDLCHEAQKKLRALRLEDIDNLFSLRLSGKERVWGVLGRGVLTLLWWDPVHAVCPSSKKNT